MRLQQWPPSALAAATLQTAAPITQAGRPVHQRAQITCEPRVNTSITVFIHETLILGIAYLHAWIATGTLAHSLVRHARRDLAWD